MDENDSNTLYVASYDIFKSTNAGDTWKKLEGTKGWVRDIGISPSNHQIVYAGSSYGVIRSSDQGETWSIISPGLENLDVYSVALDPSDPNRVLAGTYAGSVMEFQFREPPRITNAFLQGKHLIVEGENFKSGAAIYLNDEKQKTQFNEQNPNQLIGKKTAKKISPGQTVTIKVQNADGAVSEAFSFTKTP
jgi:WD40 repeat protein